MGETYIFQVQAANGPCLALIVIYSYRRSQPYRKLKPLEWYWRLWWYNWNMWQQGGFSFKCFSQNGCLTNIYGYILMTKLIPLHNLGGLIITQEKNRGTNLQPRIMCWHISRDFKKGVKFTAWFSLTLVSMDLKDIRSLGNNCNILMLISS